MARSVVFLSRPCECLCRAQNAQTVNMNGAVMHTLAKLCVSAFSVDLGYSDNAASSPAAKPELTRVKHVQQKP